MSATIWKNINRNLKMEELPQLIQKQIEHIQMIQKAIDRYDNSAQLLALTQSLNFSVSTLDIMLSWQTPEPTIEDEEFDQAFKEAEERHRKARDDFEKRSSRNKKL
jgi:conjugal transfer/entry exclusion protein